MIFLYIILGVIAVILLLLLLPLYFEVTYTDKIALRVGWIFIKFQVYPKKPPGAFMRIFTLILKRIRIFSSSVKKRLSKTTGKGGSRKKKSEEQKSSWASLLEERGFIGAVGMILKVSIQTTGASKDLLRRITVTRLDVSAGISGEDAAETAISYGAWCSVLYPAISLILCAVKRYKNTKVDIKPDFTSGESRCIIKLDFYLIPGRALMIALKIFIGLIIKTVSDKVALIRSDSLKDINNKNKTVRT